MLELPLYLAAFAALFLGAVVQSLIGFGMAIVAAPLLYLIEPALVPVPLLLHGMTISMLNLWRHRSSTNVKSMGLALVWRIPGSLVGLWLLVAFSGDVVRVVIALAVLMGVATTLTKASVPITRWSLSVAGFLSGIFSTAAAIGGPPIALLLRNQQAAALRANLSAFFTLSGLTSLGILALAGQIQLEHLTSAATLLPAVFVGFAMAKQFSDKVEKRHIQRATQLLCTASALALIYQTL